MVSEVQASGSAVLQVGQLLARVAVEHGEDRGADDQAVVVAAPDRRVEEEVAGLLEAGQRAELGASCA